MRADVSQHRIPPRSQCRHAKKPKRLQALVYDSSTVICPQWAKRTVPVYKPWSLIDGSTVNNEHRGTVLKDMSADQTLHCIPPRAWCSQKIVVCQKVSVISY